MLLYLVDAFTNAPFKGNPAGVCIVAEYPDAAQMQALAAYFGWSETAFVKPLADDWFHIRWFSPLDEAPLCGHATLGAAHILFSKNLTASNEIRFQYRDGEILASLKNDGIGITLPLKPIRKCHDIPFSTKDTIGIAEHIEIWRDELMYVVILKDANAVSLAKPNFAQIKAVNARAVAVTGSGGLDGCDFSSRYFAPRVGIFEDPVCGSMHCRLAHYWSNRLGKTKLLAHQASRRSGTLRIEVKDDTVELSSQVVTVCEINCIGQPTLYNAANGKFKC